MRDSWNGVGVFCLFAQQLRTQLSLTNFCVCMAAGQGEPQGGPGRECAQGRRQPRVGQGVLLCCVVVSLRGASSSRAARLASGALVRSMPGCGQDLLLSAQFTAQASKAGESVKDSARSVRDSTARSVEKSDDKVRAASACMAAE